MRPGREEPAAVAHDDMLGEEVRALLRGGLPIRAAVCGPGLLGLRGVMARALRPEDMASRARALDGLLREQLAHLENTELAQAARLLFGAEATTAGASLTARRQAAAQASGYEVHHFRKRIEPKLAELVAWQLRRDSEAFANRHSPPALGASSGPLVLPADVFAWEAAEHQQALATLWGAVYLLRAELLGVAALVSMEADEPTVEAATAAALWRYALVMDAAASYRAAYGQVLLHAAAELGPALGPDQIAACAGWTPQLSPTQELLLTGCAAPEAGLSHFATALSQARGGPQLAAAWRQALTGRTSRAGDPDPVTEQEERSV